MINLNAMGLRMTDEQLKMHKELCEIGIPSAALLDKNDDRYTYHRKMQCILKNSHQEKLFFWHNMINKKDEIACIKCKKPFIVHEQDICNRIHRLACKNNHLTEIGFDEIFEVNDDK